MSDLDAITDDVTILQHRIPTHHHGALVIGGEYRALGIVRSLGRRGIPVWVLTDDHRLAAASRYAQHRLRWPTHPKARPVDYLLTLAARHNLTGWTIFPSGDQTAALIGHHHAVLAEWFRLTTPTWDVLRWAHDKRLTYQLAASTGVDFPWTICPGPELATATIDCPFPVILKPAVKEGFNEFTHAKAWRVDDRESLIERFGQASRLADPDMVMIQELIPGSGEQQFSYAALCSEGRPLAWVTARRTRQYPIDFGRSSTFVETIENPAVEELSGRLIAALGFTGLIEVEFKRDPRDGKYKLLDLNPRAWGWHTLGRRAGVDFPYLLWRMVHGELVPVTRGSPGVRWIRLTTDALAAVQEIVNGRLSLTDYVRSLRGPLEFATLSLDDLLPALVDVPLLLYLALKRGAT